MWHSATLHKSLNLREELSELARPHQYLTAVVCRISLGECGFSLCTQWFKTRARPLLRLMERLTVGFPCVTGNPG